MPFIGNPPPSVLQFTAMEDLLSAPSPGVEGTLAKVRRYYRNYTDFGEVPQPNYQMGDFLGGGLFQWTGETIPIDNLMTFPAATGGTWVRVIESGQPFDIRWAGTYGNGINNDAQAMVNAFNMMQNTINGPIPTSFPDLYAKIGNTIFFPAGSYYVNGVNPPSFFFWGKVVGHQYFNSQPTELSSEIVCSNGSFYCQEIRNLNISGDNIVYITSVKLSGCYFGLPVYLFAPINPYPPKLPTNTPLATIAIQGCQFLDTSSFSLTILSGNSSNAQVIINGSVFQGGFFAFEDITDLVINECYILNSSGEYVPGIPPVEADNGHPILAMSPSTKAITLTSGTSATNPAYLLTATIRIPVTLSPTSTAAATVSVAITDQYGNTTTTTMASAPAGSTAGVVQTVTFDVPPQASYTVTATNATLEEGTISYNATGISLAATSVSLQ